MASEPFFARPIALIQLRSLGEIASSVFPFELVRLTEV